MDPKGSDMARWKGADMARWVEMTTILVPTHPTCLLGVPIS